MPCPLCISASFQECFVLDRAPRTKTAGYLFPHLWRCANKFFIKSRKLRCIYSNRNSDLPNMHLANASITETLWTALNGAVQLLQCLKIKETFNFNMDLIWKQMCPSMRGHPCGYFTEGCLYIYTRVLRWSSELKFCTVYLAFIQYQSDLP